MDDTELARRCVEGDSSAWGQLVHLHLDVVYRSARRVLGGDADVEDVVQSVFVKLVDHGCRRLRSFQGRSRLSTWLVAVTRREALDHLGKSRRAEVAKVSLDRLVHELQDDPASPMEVEQESARVRSALDRLPVRDGLLVRLVYVDGASYEEAAKLLAVPVNSISPWLVRSKERLRGFLQKDVRIEPPGASNG